MRAPTRVLRAAGIGQSDLAEVSGQTVQYVSMQLNGHRPLTADLQLALRELAPEAADEVVRRRGEQ